MKTSLDIPSYIKSYPKDVQTILQKVRSTIQSAAPKATEAMKYGLPTFILNNKNLIHFGGFKKHIGLYPSPSGIANFSKELTPYETSKGAIQFPLDRPIPFGLITKITKFRVKEILMIPQQTTRSKVKTKKVSSKRAVV